MQSVHRLVLALVFLSAIALFVVTGGMAQTIAPGQPQLQGDAAPTPDPYAGLTIDELRARSYGQGAIQVIRTLTVTHDFTRTLVAYPSDGLTVYAFVNTPRSPGPHPVVLVLHGYVAPSRYRTTTYTTRYADALARAGFLVLHPNFRDHPPSDPDPGPNLFRVGYAVDVLNLIALVKAGGGLPGLLAAADPTAIGLWGHSMGGGVALRALTVSRDVRAAVLYGSMSADERVNYEQIRLWSGGSAGQELSTPDGVLRRISPVYFLDGIRAAVSVHHGDADPTVPPEWSADLCRRLQAVHVSAECFTYPDQPHVFTGPGDREFIERTIAFFHAHLDRLDASRTP